METRKKRALQELRRLSRSLDGEVVYENGIQVLKIAPVLGVGEVRCVCFDKGLIAMEFDILINRDISMRLELATSNMIYFLYCFRGNCFHKFDGHDVIAKLEELQTAVVSNKKDTASELLIRKDERMILNLIRLEKDSYIKKFQGDTDGFDAKTLALIDTIDSNEGYFHLGRLNLEIGELIKLMENAKYANDVSTLMQFEGICHLILAKQIEQFNIELQHGLQASSTLSKSALRIVSEIGDFVKNYPEVQHSVDGLCRRSGLSAAKLQQGFKFIYDMTIGEYVRDCRLVRAEYLIRTTEMNVSEVVYSIGFTSRSYFCKIFKAKYRCSPKMYKNRVYSTGIAPGQVLITENH
ncbi:helix-turn-helix transcriptional regulator [Flavobacteriaceae bacterium TP-CH-4]|uniref:Helix-turn-helix transcriptional regulator n=1 Tax=Pelagihabitans pacificus TaxID=2696054 RepID=A0A967E6Y6_9FLAO|nr:helix-turn-helix transcriptional regulator [Pelagihabitans pacificus]NHF61022.1 helix-turn-helix transcriptional regulator [Pelagihabitans pacificus]